MGNPVGGLLREWRQRRRLTQMGLALDVDISPKHLCFVESGRARPSRELLLRLAERLDVPLRERNELLLAAGFAPVFPIRQLSDPALDLVRNAMELVLTGHEPYPALAIDRHWTLVAANRMLAPLLATVKPELLKPPVNVLRLTIHPEGLAQQIANYPVWRSHVFEKLRRQIEVSADIVLVELLRELRAYAVPPRWAGVAPPTDSAAGFGAFVVPFQLHSGEDVLSFFSTTTVFGTPVEVTLSELSIESFYPADEQTAARLQKVAQDLPAR
jgi:transcriptional regulator with XRE-family HTH domain